MLALTVPAAAQDRSTDDRLDRLERDLNMLQRQVYRGAPSPTGGNPSAAMGMEVRLNRLEDQMRDLTGRVEEYGNQVDQLRARLEQVNGDVAARYNEGPPAGPIAGGGPPPGRAVPPPGRVPPPPDSLAAGPGPHGLSDSDFPPPPPGMGRSPEPIFGTLTPPGTPAPPSPLGSSGNVANSAGASLGPASGRSAAGGSPTDQYNHAFGLLKQADYPGAEAELRAFVEQHPNDPMAGNAQYWLGDTYYARGRYTDAARAFAEVYKRYPKSAKAPEALLKLGMSLGQANQKPNACVALAQLDQVPHAASNVKQQAAAEKKRLGCP